MNRKEMLLQITLYVVWCLLMVMFCVAGVLIFDSFIIDDKDAIIVGFLSCMGYMALYFKITNYLCYRKRKYKRI